MERNTVRGSRERGETQVVEEADEARVECGKTGFTPIEGSCRHLNRLVVFLSNTFLLHLIRQNYEWIGLKEENGERRKLGGGSFG
jgi:hypothetical protein